MPLLVFFGFYISYSNDDFYRIRFIPTDNNTVVCISQYAYSGGLYNCTDDIVHKGDYSVIKVKVPNQTFFEYLNNW
jgi:hypothetical protein